MRERTVHTARQKSSLVLQTGLYQILYQRPQSKFCTTMHAANLAPVRPLCNSCARAESTIYKATNVQKCQSSGPNLQRDDTADSYDKGTDDEGSGLTPMSVCAQYYTRRCEILMLSKKRIGVGEKGW